MTSPSRKHAYLVSDTFEWIAAAGKTQFTQKFYNQTYSKLKTSYNKEGIRILNWLLKLRCVSHVERETLMPNSCIPSTFKKYILGIAAFMLCLCVVPVASYAADATTAITSDDVQFDAPVLRRARLESVVDTYWQDSISGKKLNITYRNLAFHTTYRYTGRTKIDFHRGALENSKTHKMEVGVWTKWRNNYAIS